MNDSSLSISEETAFELIGLALAGAMTEETYMELRASLGNVKIIKPSTSQGGSTNSSLSAETRELNLERWFTNAEEQQTQDSNTPRSHFGCWCNSSKKRDTNNGN
jgi:hypothetical protein